MTKEQRLKKRHAAEKRFRLYGLTSILVALVFVLILVNNIYFFLKYFPLRRMPKMMR